MVRAPRAAAFVALLGLYLTAHGYHSLDGDQAYRLPLLLHARDARLYRADPFVRAFDAFQPHRDYLRLLDAASHPAGLSAGLFALFVAVYALTAWGVDRSARRAFPEGGPGVGLVAVGLVLMAQAGNVGTNHLFEATLLDRLVALALGWGAIAASLGDRRWARAIAPGLVAIAARVHPSMGFQIGALLGATWAVEALPAIDPRPGRPGPRPIGRLVPPLLLVAGLAPTAIGMARQGDALTRGMGEADFRALSTLVQGPQHMIPHLWRGMQWLAFAGYPALAALALARAPRPWPTARRRLALLMGVNALALVAAWAGVEWWGDLTFTLLQPFRMATLFRGLCLVAIADHAWGLWRSGSAWGRVRAGLIAVGLVGDGSWVVVSGSEAASIASPAAGVAALVAGLAYLSRHDTGSGHVRILAGLAAIGAAVALPGRVGPSGTWAWGWTRRRCALIVGLAWAVPVAAMAVPALGLSGRAADALAARLRFGETPTGDLERLAAWCRRHTPESAVFVGPPGPKEFRLWSRRSVAFNRAASPYHAAGLADWAARYRDHVGFSGPVDAFARAYLADRHALEARFGTLSDSGLAALARRQGADHVLTAHPRPVGLAEPGGPLALLRSEGRFAVYRVGPARR